MEIAIIRQRSCLIAGSVEEEQSNGRTLVVRNSFPSAETEPLQAPRGPDEIIAPFGAIYEYIGTDGQLETRWQLVFLTKVSLPFAGHKLSAHRRGTTIDLNPETNLPGAVGDMDARLIEIFRSAGFEWGRRLAR